MDPARDSSEGRALEREPAHKAPEEIVKARRLSDSNIFGTSPRNDDETIRVQQPSASRRRPSHLSSVPSRPISQQEYPLGTLAWQPQQRQRSIRYGPTIPPGVSASPTKSSSQTQEDTFNCTLEIRVHHSVGSMSISPSCRDIVLAGRQGLLIIDLEDPWGLPRILTHLSKWEVADVQWSPYVSRESWVASTSNQKLLVWNLNYSGSRAIENVLHAHSRAISDINWSPHHPDMLATCSVDTYVHIWDLRCAGQSKDDPNGQPLRPANSFTSWNAATTQVKYNRKSEYLLASAHDKDVKIWDIRKGAIPVTTIEAHTKKIYGIDWSRQNDHDIVTCSLDHLVKYWNINTPEKEEEAIMTNSPVWRARNTPFGNGVLTMPQRTETTLYLYNRATPTVPVHKFEGHSDTVKEFVWRWKGGNGAEGDDREFQLVTWSKDQYLRLWPITEDIMKSVDHKFSSKKTTYRVPVSAVRPDGSVQSRSFQKIPDEVESMNGLSAPTPSGLRKDEHISTMSVLRSGGTGAGTTGISSSGYDTMSNAYREQKYAINPLLWMQNVKTVGPPTELRRAATTESTYPTVAEEMTTVLSKYASAGVKTEKVNGASRTCTITLHGPWSDTGNTFVRLTIRFSAQYPDNSPPEFDIQKNSMMSIYYRAHMYQELNALASSYTSQKRWCLEACIRCLLGESLQEDAELGLEKGKEDMLGNGFGNANQPNNYWNGSSTGVDNGDSDDEIFAGPSFMGGVGGGYGVAGKRVSLQSEKGIVVDMSSKQSADEKVPFPRLCGGVFSGSGQLVCFFSTLRMRDSKRDSSKDDAEMQEPRQGTSPASNTSNTEYFENTYSDFYKHPRTYEQFEEYKEIAAMSRQGRNATVLVGGTGGAFGEYAYDDDPDDIDDGLTNMTSLYFKPDSFALGGSITNTGSLLYRNPKADRITYNVIIADLRKTLPYDAELAKEYILTPGDPVAACTHNAAVCKNHDRMDLSRVWYLASEIVKQCIPLDSERGWAPEPIEILQRDAKNLHDIRTILYGPPRSSPKSTKLIPKKRRVKWGLHPLGRKFINNLLQHFVSIGDVQTAAMLSCIFHTSNTQVLQSARKVQNLLPEHSNGPRMSLDSSKIRAQSLVRTGSGPVTMVSGSPDRATTTQLSASYGTSRGVNFLSYFWDTDRHTPPGEKSASEAMQETPTAYAKRITRPFSTTLTQQKIPSNTAPGLRSTPSSPLTPPGMTTTTTPFTPQAIVSDKEGKIVQTDEMSIEFTNLETYDGDKALSYNNDIPLLDPRDIAKLDVLRLNYADMLYRWGLLEKRAEVLKFLSRPPFPTTERTLVIIRCYICGSEINNRDQRLCYTCRKLRNQIRCSVCHVLVKGLLNFCSECGHGGHAHHIKDWFSEHKACPTGCGCICLIDV
ncbi:hypothetical protein BJV82DRAFT_652492 [Fennellomyces sp. T-0311]|nr:hypothetical protein BJV82DRAFT_652492 [Fennellomyces sp. T-0311]